MSTKGAHKSLLKGILQLITHSERGDFLLAGVEQFGHRSCGRIKLASLVPEGRTRMRERTRLERTVVWPSSRCC